MLIELQQYIMLALTVGALVFELGALVDALTKPNKYYLAAGKRNKKFWGLLLAGMVLLGFISLTPPLGYGSLGPGGLLAVIPAGIYFADVRPKLPRSPRSGPGPRNNSGGW